MNFPRLNCTGINEKLANMIFPTFVVNLNTKEPIFKNHSHYSVNKLKA